MKFNYSNSKYSITKCNLFLNLNNDTKWSFLYKIFSIKYNLDTKLK